MASTLCVLDAANMFVGDDPTASMHLVLKSVKIPALNERTKDHDALGGAGSLTLGLKSIEALEVAFKCEGFPTDVIAKFMSPTSNRYTIRGNFRDIRAARDIPMVAVVEGRMTSVDFSEFSREGGMETDYMLKQVTSYNLVFDGREMFNYDAFIGLGSVRINGAQVFGTAAANLGLV